MKLRGHHIFCTALFSGHGYDERFTEKMGSIISQWQRGENACVVTCADEVCSACPNLTENGGCTLGTDNVFTRDTAALRVLGLCENQPLSWSEAGKLLSQISEEDFQAVCGNCRWQQEGLCSFEHLAVSISGRKQEKDKSMLPDQECI